MTARTPQQQVDDFVEANRKSPVVAGRVLEPDPSKPSKGSIYTLKNGDRFRLGGQACAMLPPGWPRWAL